MREKETILLCSVGTSPLVVPEAWFAREEGYGAVHCLTSDSEKVNEAIERHGLPIFFEKMGATFTLKRVPGFVDLRNQKEHNTYEEVLYRWYLNYADPENLPDVCLAGGFKSMVAGLQKAAQYFGARRVFHVLCEIPDAEAHNGYRNPGTLEEVEQAHAKKLIQFIELGPESGWPQIQALRAERRNLPDSLRVHIRQIQEKTALRARGWEQVAEVPFPGVSLWTQARRQWLNEPLQEKSDRDWVAGLPKVELHCHLGGFATHGTSLEKVRKAAWYPERLPTAGAPGFPENWPRPGTPAGLNPYRKLGDATGSTLLSDPGCLEAQCKLLYEYLKNERILYAEIRCSPNNYTKYGESAWNVLKRIRETFHHCRKAAKDDGDPCPTLVNLIIIVTRKREGDLSGISRHLALAVTAAQEHQVSEKQALECQVVGVDLAGFEQKETRARYFATDFEAAHRCGLAVTAHAGENDNPEGIWQAVHRLFARRLGHALCLEAAPDLMRTVADRAIGVEMCPYANFQIRGFAPMPGKPPYPLLNYLRAGIRVTVNTDNPGISAAGLSDNLLFLAQLSPEIRRLDLLQLQRNALEVAFLRPEEKKFLLETFESSLQQLQQ